jgi:hypothetical protein
MNISRRLELKTMVVPAARGPANPLGAARMIPMTTMGSPQPPKSDPTQWNPPIPQKEPISNGRTAELLSISKKVMSGAQELLAFVDDNRDAARLAGVETIAIELASMMEGERLTRVHSTLEKATLSGNDAEVTMDGIDRLKRAEKLLAEAGSAIKKTTPSPVSLGARARELAQTTGATDPAMLLGIFALGALAALGIVWIIGQTKTR